MKMQTQTLIGKRARVRLVSNGALVLALLFGTGMTGVTQRAGVSPIGSAPLQRPGQNNPIPTQQTNPSFPSTGPLIDGGMDPNPLGHKADQQQAKSRNTDRQRRMVADTELLLRLATELKTDVDKSNKDVLSLDVIKKAEEIEKLAHGVKERMKG